MSLFHILAHLFCGFYSTVALAVKFRALCRLERQCAADLALDSHLSVGAHVCRVVLVCGHTEVRGQLQCILLLLSTILWWLLFWFLVCVCLFVFEARFHHVATDWPEIQYVEETNLKPQRSACLCLSCTEIKGVCYYTWLCVCVRERERRGREEERGKRERER